MKSTSFHGWGFTEAFLNRFPQHIMSLLLIVMDVLYVNIETNFKIKELFNCKDYNVVCEDSQSSSSWF